MASEGIWRGAAEATGRIPGLALNLAQMQQQGQHMRALEADSQKRLALEGQRLGIAEKTAGIQREGLEIANRKAKMEADALADSVKLIPVNETLVKIGITRPAEQKVFLEYAGPHVEIGEASGQPVIQKQHAKALWEKMSKDVDFGIRLGSIRGAEINKEIAALQGQLTNPETAGKIKPEQAKQIQGQIESLVEQRTMADNALKMLKQRQRAANKDKYQNVQLPDGTWAAVDVATGDTIPIQGTPEGVVKEQGKPAAIRSVDRGDVVDIYENGVKVRTEKKGRAPGTGEEKPSRLPWRDTRDGHIEYFDKNDPKDRVRLQKEGKFFQAVAENPIAPIIRESLQPDGKAAYKTPEEVKAAYEGNKIGKDEAVKILREQFGLK